MGLIDGKLSILGLDPGGTTGWALYTADVIHDISGIKADGPVPEFYKEKWTAGQLGPGPHHRQLYGLLRQWTTANTIIVCESFEYRRNPKDRQRDNIVLDSKEYIGVVNLYKAQWYHDTQNMPGEFRVVYQTAALGKGFWTDEKMKQVGKFSTPKTKWPHANDAMRHLLHYMTFKMNRQDLLLPLKGLG